MNADEQGRWTAQRAREAFATAPEVTLDGLCLGGRLLVVAPHPDDETLGCGGLIASAAAAGRAVTVAALTDGEASHPKSSTYPSDRLARLRRSELGLALDQLTGPHVQLAAFGAADGRLNKCEGQAQAWLAGLATLEPFDAVFVTWAADPHPDHQAAFRIASRQAAAWGAALFAYPIWGLTLPDDADAGLSEPCVKLDVTAMLPQKRAAIAAHRSQTTNLIDDDPEGFRLSRADLERHLGRYEVFLRMRPDRDYSQR